MIDKNQIPNIIIILFLTWKTSVYKPGSCGCVNILIRLHTYIWNNSVYKNGRTYIDEPVAGNKPVGDFKDSVML